MPLEHLVRTAPGLLSRHNICFQTSTAIPDLTLHYHALYRRRQPSTSCSTAAPASTVGWRWTCRRCTATAAAQCSFPGSRRRRWRPPAAVRPPLPATPARPSMRGRRSSAASSASATWPGGVLLTCATGRPSLASSRRQSVPETAHGKDSCGAAASCVAVHVADSVADSGQRIQGKTPSAAD